MKREWSVEELAEQWTLLASERDLLANKTGSTRLGFAVLYLARQTGVPAVAWIHYDWNGRAAKYHRTEIRAQLGFREATVEDGEAMVAWLDEHVLYQDRQMERLRAALLERCRSLCVEPPTPDRLDRLIRSAIHRNEERFCNALLARLTADTQTQLDALLLPGEPEPEAREPSRALLQALRADPGRASLQSVLDQRLHPR